MKRPFILPLLLLSGQLLFAQNEEDIVRYSVTTNTGSARSSAMGGAFGALGGDLSAFSVNPAGIGVYRNSEISVTPYLNVANTSSDNRSVRKTSFQLGSFGGVFSLYNNRSDWKGINFGINYTNQNNFSRKTSQFIYGSPTNFPQVWANEANLAIYEWEKFHNKKADWETVQNIIPDRSRMAYDVQLIEWVEDGDGGHYEPNLFNGESVDQHRYIQEDGYQGEYDFSIGTNFKDKLYLGLTVGIQSVRYKYKSYYTGTPVGSTRMDIARYDFDTYLKTKGVGSNFKVGMIYRPVPELRLGVAVHTPTYYSMSDDYEEALYSKFNTPDENGHDEYGSYPGIWHYNYDMQTPWKAVFSLATVWNGKFILSADYEFNNYHSAKFSDADGNDYYEQNEAIRQYLKNTNNVRIGAEYRVNSLFSLRSGYSCWDSPYRYTSAGKVQAVSGGFGFNLGNFFCDASYSCKFAKNTTRFYNYLDPEDQAYDLVAEPVKNEYRTHEAKLTFGIRF